MPISEPPPARALGRRWHPAPSRVTGLLLIAPLTLFLVLFVILPIGKVVLDSFPEGDRLGSYQQFFASQASVKALVRTLWIGLLVTLITVLTGAVLAWYLRTMKSRLLKTLIWASILIPFWMGIVIKNYVFIILLGRQGVMNRVLEMAGIINTPVDLLYTETAVIIGMVYTMLPYAALPLFAAMTTIDPDLVRAAQSLGASRTRAVSSVVLPLATPGIMASGTIVFVISLGFYITPVILGGARTPFVATLIQEDIFRRFDYPSAAATSTLLLAAAVVTIIVSLALVGRERLERAVA